MQTTNIDKKLPLRSDQESIPKLSENKESVFYNIIFKTTFFVFITSFILALFNLGTENIFFVSGIFYSMLSFSKRILNWIYANDLFIRPKYDSKLIFSISYIVIFTTSLLTLFAAVIVMLINKSTEYQNFLIWTIIVSGTISLICSTLILLVLKDYGISSN